MIRALRIGIPVLVIALALAMFSVTPALAAKGGNGRGPNNPPTSTARCSVAPNPVAQWALDTISGSGFTPNASLGYFITGSGGTAMGFAVTDSTGSFSTISQGVWLGTNTVTVSGSGATASCSFQVN